ncbi:MAG: tRNA pseudouridine(55) synthase TruB [Treponema sp.]|nr:tRNA pseudouridine(55) synthase TruB [Treponema sp.]
MTAPGQHGLLLLNKKSGVTSFDSLKEVKRAFATGKAGHTGTLDKFATGLLAVLVGRGVKLASLFSGLDKEYTATVRFGEETDTLDPEGAVIARSPLPPRNAVEAVLDEFRGDIMQAPPAYSAIHIGGRRAHELVREGKAPEMKKRPVTIHSLEILSWAPPEMTARVRCSAGTYIRSLARDIAIAAGSSAHLSGLVRTSVGAFRLEDSTGTENLVDALRPLDRNLFQALSLPCFLIDDRAAKDFSHGKPLRQILGPQSGDFPAAEKLARAAGVFREASPGDLLGVLERREDGAWGYGHVFAAGGIDGA